MKPLTQLFGALFPGHSTVKNLPANAGDARDMDSIPGSGRSPGEGNGNAVQYLLGNPVEKKKSLVGYTPRGCKELNTTEQLILSFKRMVVSG